MNEKTKKSIILNIGDSNISLSKACNKYGIKNSTLRNRISIGMDHNDAISKPIGNNSGLPVQALKDGVVIQEFASATEAGKFLGVSDASNISKACRSRKGIVLGYSWKFKE